MSQKYCSSQACCFSVGFSDGVAVRFTICFRSLSSPLFVSPTPQRSGCRAALSAVDTSVLLLLLLLRFLLDAVEVASPTVSAAAAAAVVVVRRADSFVAVASAAVVVGCLTKI